MPGTGLGMRDTEITKTQPLSLGPQKLVGEADRQRQLNMTVAMIKAKTRSGEATRRGRSLREGLTESGWLELAVRVSMKSPAGRMWKVVVSRQHSPAGRSREHQRREGKATCLGNYNTVWQAHAVGGGEEWELRLQGTVHARGSCVPPTEAKIFPKSIQC